MKSLNTSYKKWLEEIKRKIKTTQLQVAVSANAQLIELYWELAKEIIDRQNQTEWGEAMIDQLSIDLRMSFPCIKGFLTYTHHAEVSLLKPRISICATGRGTNSLGT